MLEKELTSFFEKILKAHDIPFFHIPNRTFSRGRVSASLKYVPDYIFPWGKQVHFWEFGIPGRHKERKQKQRELMENWHHLGNIRGRFIMSMDGLIKSLEELGFNVPKSP